MVNYVVFYAGQTILKSITHLTCAKTAGACFSARSWPCNINLFTAVTALSCHFLLSLTFVGKARGLYHKTNYGIINSVP